MTTLAWRYKRPEILDLVEKPTMSVAVVIACRGGQEKLNLTVAALAAQNYPQKLMTVYIVDDGSTPGLKLPPVRPSNTKLITFKNTASQWGKTDATNYCTAKLKEDVLWFLDADMVVDPNHLSHHMKWHHESSDYLVLGWKRFVEDWNYDPQTLFKSLKSGKFSGLHPVSAPKQSWEDLIEKSDDLRSPTMASFRAVVGASFSIMRRNWVALGGYNPEFRIGEDTEFGWRSLIGGLRLVPERQALSWHLGISTVVSNRQIILQHNKPNFANHIPDFGYLRDELPIDWAVPENEVLIDARHMSIESFENLIRQFFVDSRGHAVFRIIGPWRDLATRYSPIDDRYLDLREIRNIVGQDSRFILEEIEGDRKLLISEILDLIEIGSTPLYFFVEGNLDPKINFSSLRHALLKYGNGLEGIVDRAGSRTFGIYAPALSRAKSAKGSAYLNLEKCWGIRWREIEQYDSVENPPRKTIVKNLKSAFRALKRIRSIQDLKKYSKRVARGIKP